MRIFVLFKEGTDQVVMPGATLNNEKGETFTLVFGKAPPVVGNVGGAVVVRDSSGEEFTMYPGELGLEYRKV